MSWVTKLRALFPNDHNIVYYSVWCKIKPSLICSLRFPLVARSFEKLVAGFLTCSNLRICEESTMACDHLKKKPLSSSFMWSCLIRCVRWFLFQSVYKHLVFGHRDKKPFPLLTLWPPAMQLSISWDAILYNLISTDKNKPNKEQQVNKFKYWPVTCHGDWVWHAVDEVSVLEFWVFGIWKRSSSIELEDFYW